MFGKKKLQAELEKSQRVVVSLDRASNQKLIKTMLLDSLYKQMVVDSRYRIVSTHPYFKEIKEDLRRSGWKVHDSFCEEEAEYEIWIPGEAATKLGQEKKSDIEESIEELFEQTRIAAAGYKELFGRIEAIENTLDSKKRTK
jgi:hypothetical protein